MNKKKFVNKYSNVFKEQYLFTFVKSQFFGDYSKTN